MRTQIGRNRVLPALTLLAVVATAAQPLLRGHLPWRGDGLLHFYRLTQLERAIAYGELYPRLLPDMGFGFGFPLFNYYAPLSYYLMLPLRWLGISAEQTLTLGYLCALLVTAAGCYLWAYRLTGSPVSAIVAATAAAYAPYILYNIHHRGALAEAWGIAWLALCFWAAVRWRQQGDGASFMWLTLSYAALMLTHNITALIGTPLLLLYTVLFSIDKRNSWRRFGRLCVPFAVGLALSAFFWLPAFVEKELVQIEQLYAPSNFDFRHNFSSFAELFARPISADSQQVNPPIPLSLSWPVLLLAAVGLFRRPRQTALLGVAAAGLIVLMLPQSGLLWEAIPLAQFIQFPWRLLGVVSLVVAVLAGVGAAQLPFGPRWQAAAAYAIIAVYALSWIFPATLRAELDPSPLGLIAFEQETGALGTTSAADYLPRAVTQLPDPTTLIEVYQQHTPHPIPRLDTTSIPADVQATEHVAGLLSSRVAIDAPQPFTIRFNWYDFAGWQLLLDGVPLETFATGADGLISADIPAGQHTLMLDFATTPLRYWSTRLSWLAALLVLGVAVRTWFAGRDTVAQLSASQIIPFATPQQIGPLLVAALLLLLGKTVVLDRQNNIFHRHAFDGQSIVGIAHPLQENFDHRLVLLGYELSEVQVVAGDLLDTALYWRSAAATNRDYSVALHLIDANGNRYGQHDSYHPAGFPVSRWQPHEYARDLHRLLVDPHTPPGSYTLLLSVYETVSGRRITRLNEGGLPVGTTYDLATLTVLPPDRPTPPPTPQYALAPIDTAADIKLLGFDLPFGDQVAVGQFMPVTVYWQVAQATETRPQLELSLHRTQLQTVQQYVLGQTDYRWEVGQTVRETHLLLIPAVGLDGGPIEAGTYQLELGLRDERERPSLASVPLAVSAPSRTFDPPVVGVPVGQTFGESAQLFGYTVKGTLKPHELLEFELVWRSLTPLTTQYTIFVHLLDENDQIVAQSDQLPARATTSWLSDEYLADPHLLFPPAAGTYRVAVGLYDAVSGDRLGERLTLPLAVEIQE